MNTIKEKSELEQSGNEKQHTQYALGKVNYVFIFISLIFIITGFLLMTGSGSTDEAYNPDIFSTRRIVIAPTITFLGFVSIIFGILYRPRKK